MGVIDEVEINLLKKDMRGREVPPDVPKICTHKFREIWSCKISKINRKIMQIKYLLKLKILWVQYRIYIYIYIYIYSSKKIFSLLFFCLDHTLEDNDDIFLVLKINQGPQVVYSQMNSLNGEEHM